MSVCSTAEGVVYQRQTERHICRHTRHTASRATQKKTTNENINMQKHSCLSNSSSSLSSQSSVATGYANDLYTGCCGSVYESEIVFHIAGVRGEGSAAPSLQPAGRCDVADGGGESITYYISLVCAGAWCLSPAWPHIILASGPASVASTSPQQRQPSTVRGTNDEFDFIVSHTIAPAMRPAAVRALPGLARLHVHPPCGKTHDTRLASWLAGWQPCCVGLTSYSAANARWRTPAA